MSDDIQDDASADANLLPAAEGANVLNPEVAAAINTIKVEIERNERDGESGAARTRFLIGELDDVLFSTATAARANRPASDGALPQALVLFGARSLEVLVRSLKETGTLASGLRYLLREAPDDLVVAHALAASALAEQASDGDLRQSAGEALSVCREIAQARGFADRLEVE